MNDSKLDKGKPSRLAQWDALSDYPAHVSSLWHIPAGETLRRAISRVSTRGVAADLGCGPGYWLETLSEARTIHAVDFSSNMLKQARERAPEQTEFHQMNLRDLILPSAADLALCFNALMPESHSDALDTLSKVFASVAPGGQLVLVVPSLEALLYSANAIHFAAAHDGKERESLQMRMDTWSAWYSNPLGYVLNGNETVVKYWIKEEAEEVFRIVGGTLVREYFRLDNVKNATGEMPPPDWQQPWYHGWILTKE